jgi:hypothetical protein
MCVDAINTVRVLASRFTLFRVVSLSQIQYFRTSRLFFGLVRFPAAPQEEGPQIRRPFCSKRRPLHLSARVMRFLLRR